MPALPTQIKVEEMLRQGRGLTRYDLGRDAFLARLGVEKAVYGNRIVEQQKSLGVPATGTAAASPWTRLLEGRA